MALRGPVLDELPDVCVADIDRCVNSHIFDKTFSAAACVASIGSRVFHRKVYGSPVHPPPLRRISHDTVFDLASLTKPLATGLAALHLVSRSRMDLGAPLSKTIPEFRAPRFDNITLDMLLEHTAGFPSTRKFWHDIAEHDARVAKADRLMGTAKAAQFVKELVSDVTIEYEPGTKVVYSDVGFMALGWVIEGIVGMPLDVYLQREIYRPLGLADDLFFVRLDDARARARLKRRVFAATEQCPWREKLLQGEVHDPCAWAMGGVAGHAGLFGTADAVWRLLKTLLACYLGEDRTFLGGTVRRFWTRSKRLRQTTRTLGWDTPTTNDSSVGKRYSRNAVGHLGYTGTSIWIDLSSDVIGVLLTNAVHPTLEGKQEVMKKFRPRIYEFIAKEAESLPAQGDKKTGAAAFYSPTGAGLSIGTPLKGPGKPRI
ncbi:MAG: serine hydrolase [Myxococcota bacterium]